MHEQANACRASRAVSRLYRRQWCWNSSRAPGLPGWHFFELDGRLHFRTFRHPHLQRDQALGNGNIELGCPPQRHEQVEIRDRRLVAEQVLAYFPVSKPPHSLVDVLVRAGLVFLARADEERLEALVDLRGNIGQRLQELRAPQNAIQSQFGRLRRDPVEHRDVLGDDVAAVDQEGWHVALGVDGREVRARFGQLALQVDAFQLEVEAGFEQRDVAGETAGAG